MDDDDEDHSSFCPMCDSETAPSGKLGKLWWFTCRMCGWWWSGE